MEKTMARAIYKRMEIGKEYTTMDLFRLIEDVYYSYVPVEMQGKDVRRIVSAEVWKIVKAGFAKTHTAQETLGNVRGIKYGATPKSYATYTFRYYRRIK